MTDQSYNVPVVPPDLRREETIHQLCDSLAYLDTIANDVFTCIGQRVAENHSHLRAINDRVNLAQAKIDRIKGTNKATKVFSSAKYPSVEEEEMYQSVFKDTNGRHEIKHSNYKLQSKHPPVDEIVLKEKLQFYNVQLNIRQEQKEDDQGGGLGRLPRSIPSVSSLLLFNTSENP